MSGINRKPSAAQAVMRGVESRKRQQHKAVEIEGEFEKAIARRLEQRGIVSIPGRHQDEGPDWISESRAAAAQMVEAQRAANAQRQADEEARNRPQSAAGILADAIRNQQNASSAAKHMPLNGSAVLRAALGGAPGTINNSQ